MSMAQLKELRKQLEVDKRGDTDYDPDDVLQMTPPQHYLENPPPDDADYLADVISALDEAATTKETKRPGPKQGASKSPPKGYPTSRDQYADPENYKYPLDTQAHVRAALSYFSKSGNRGSYSGDEQKFMWRRILAAARKYKIDVSPDVKKRAEAVGDPDPDDQDDDGGGEDELNEQQVNELVEKKIQELFAANHVTMKAKEQDGDGDDDDDDDDDDADFKQVTDQLEAFKKSVAPIAEAFGDTDPKAVMAFVKAALDGKTGYNPTMTELKNTVTDLKNRMDAMTAGAGNAVSEAEKSKEAAEKGKEKEKEKTKEAKAEGQVATDEQVKNKEGIKGPAGTQQPRDNETPRKGGFAGVMERAGHRERTSH